MDRPDDTSSSPSDPTNPANPASADVPPSTPPPGPPLAGAVPPPAGAVPPPAQAGAGQAPPNPEGDWWSGSPAGDPAQPDRAVAKRSIGTWIATGAGVVALAVAAIVGVNVASSKLSTASATSGQQGPGGMGGPGGIGGPGGFGQGQGGGTFGTLSAVDGSTLTVQGQNGTSTKVDASKATITRSTTGTVSDIEVGDNVTVLGTTSDATVTAQAIIDTRDVVDAGPGGGPGGGMPGGQLGGQMPQNGQMPAPPDLQGSGQNGQGGQMPIQPGAQTGQAGQSGAASEQTGQPPQNGAATGQVPGGPGGMAPTRGTVESIDGATLTVKTTDGSTVTVTTTDSTTVTIAEKVDVSSLETGEQVQVRGTTGSDGTVAATTVRVGEVGVRGGFGGPPGMGGANGSASGSANGNANANGQAGNGTANGTNRMPRQNGTSPNGTSQNGTSPNGGAQSGTVQQQGFGPMTRSGAS